MCKCALTYLASRGADLLDCFLADALTEIEVASRRFLTPVSCA